MPGLRPDRRDRSPARRRRGKCEFVGRHIQLGEILPGSSQRLEVNQRQTKLIYLADSPRRTDQRIRPDMSVTTNHAAEITPSVVTGPVGTRSEAPGADQFVAEC